MQENDGYCSKLHHTWLTQCRLSESHWSDVSDAGLLLANAVEPWFSYLHHLEMNFLSFQCWPLTLIFSAETNLIITEHQMFTISWDWGRNDLPPLSKTITIKHLSSVFMDVIARSCLFWLFNFLSLSLISPSHLPGPSNQLARPGPG